MTGAVFFQGLALTLVIELPIYVSLLNRFAGVPIGRAVAAATAVNVVTYPVFALIIVPFAGHLLEPRAALVVGEVIVCFLEGGMLGLWLRRDPLLIIGACLLANGCSLAAGLIAISLFGGG